MVKMVVCVKRKAGMSKAEFDRYWQHNHGPLVKSVTEFSRHLRKYVQGHTVDDKVAQFPAAGPQFDGVAELWFDSVEDMNRAFTEARYLEIIRPDEYKFVDLPGCAVMVVEEVQMK